MYPAFYAVYEVNWTAPIFTGGLSSLRYNVTIITVYDEYTRSSDTHSLVVHIEPEERVRIYVAAINPAIDCSNWREHPYSYQRFETLTSACRGKGMCIHHNIIPYSQKFSPGKNFRQFLHLLSLA